jgi:uncharacterized protein YecE (DUF72 family)
LEIRIGTSGWHYAHWRGLFYPYDLAAQEWLVYYAQHFDSVEINASFYRLPTPGTFSAWRQETPEDFLFAVKASRLITHMKKLKDAGQALSMFLKSSAELGHKLGPLLFQLPPRWRCNPERLASFLDTLPEGLRVAFEFRDASWHCDEIYALLERHGAAFCIYHLAGFESPRVVTTDFTYVRLHGPGEAYSGKYPKKALRSWAEWLRTQTGLRTVFVYFDNDQSAHAAADARELRARLR